MKEAALAILTVLIFIALVSVILVAGFVLYCAACAMWCLWVATRYVVKSTVYPFGRLMLSVCK